jgi:serine/threonine protein kinase
MAVAAVGDLVGPYRLESILGEGGMGVVFRAVRESDGAVAALKVLRFDLAGSSEYLQRFEREGRIAAGLEHEHLVHVFEAGEADGRPFIASRFVEGQSLAQRLEAGPLPLEDVVRAARELGSALDALHRRGLVHRDVKPSNVLLDATGGAALTDFGLARAVADTVLTTTGRVVGTLDYLAPEVIKGEAATPASDVYSLGCVIYECVAGRPPFAHKSLLGTAAAHVEEEPADPCAGRDDAPSGFGWAVCLALAKRPEERPATGRAYARLLAAA